MSSTRSLPQDMKQSRWPNLQKVVRSRWTFLGLQILDLSTTLAVFHYGGFEANPMVAGLTQHFGQFRGVLTSKAIAIFIALGVRRLVWVINLFYSAIVFWNILVLVGLSAKSH